MGRWPEAVADVQALVLPQPVSGRTFIERGAEKMHMNPEKAAAQLDERIRELMGSDWTN